ncbi:MAG: hypothetical protein COV74_09145 [Candidatus Omnitrophica bacterium CG11_big_fil_rev_8_21_14_0_20_45_26]|uniref:diguanylate cyclase n=1 Tax=Candidatus Abzuiibacterium crystallinum TaxID=1974748 RepID=A0A2H0LPB9_9BACT|nr:MAG: hypothetical protein COV74_09145 [Candidatus Omnitrophica bacterium CG11_big_fil_rev_8_21_14_0_20_45_26]PIW63237.1 MAG: hypothetical protein COW12_11120 [Candidatus Omnitrophica bacterium CG12_big_fil_rev_8_21_14_0_65_45_16]
MATITVDRDQSKRTTCIVAAASITVLLIILSFLALRQIQSNPLRAYSSLAIYGMACFIPLTLAWVAYNKVGMGIFAILDSIGAVVHSIVAGQFLFLFFVAAYFIYFLYVNWIEKIITDELVIREIEIEKQNSDKNDLEILYKEKGKSISVFFEKYSTYYNLRRLADEFATSLDLARLGDIIAERSLEFVQKGDVCLLSLADLERDTISLVASHSTDPSFHTKKKLGDVFDFWVLRNRQHLLVSDNQKDFRFDLKKMQQIDHMRSVIISPLLHEGRVVGTLRINARLPEIFSTDHLRLLDAISTLASSALSNAMLYQKTEELAIRDSLTQLYVQRYFKQRLKQEHRRALLTNQPLSLLICDLDFFKQINDKYGHAIGDIVLAQTAQVFRRLCDHGIVARYGGEEFTILLPQSTKTEAKQLAERIRQQVAKERVEIRRDVIPVTTSIGVATLPDDTLDQEELIRIADERLYQAKDAGRNRVC